jgi:hypothetical protein
MYASLEALEHGIQARRGLTPEYADKMLHQVPDVPSVDRVPWLVARLTGKTILHLGCVGPLHEQLLQVCTRAYGLDQEAARYPDYTRLDLEAGSAPLPWFSDVEVVLLGEVLEHLVSPGALLKQVRAGYGGCEVIITVPNAGAAGLQQHLKRGYENVNIDHKMWFSYRTLRSLVEACGLQLVAWYWCGGPPLFAEGLLFVVRAA